MPCGIERNLLPLLRIWSFRIFFMQISLCIYYIIILCGAHSHNVHEYYISVATKYYDDEHRTHTVLLLLCFSSSSSFHSPFLFFYYDEKLFGKLLLRWMRWRSCDVSDVETRSDDGENERIELIVWEKVVKSNIMVPRRRRQQNENVTNDNGGGDAVTATRRDR